MKLLIIILILPLAIFAHRYRVPSDPNDAPFLPIFPIYPYNPKLIKRGIGKDNQIHTKLYAPKPEASDSYNTNYNGHYQGDNYSLTPTQNIYQTAYTLPTNQAYSQSTINTHGSGVNYNINPYLYAIYNGYPLTLPSQSHSYNPRLPNNYQYQQHQQYHSNYHHNYSPNVGALQTGQENEAKLYDKYHDNVKNEAITKDGQFIDGMNYLVNSKEPDVSATTYRLPSHLNQDNDVSSLHLRSAQLPKSMYQIVPYDGQQFRPSNYAVSSNYKYQQLNQPLMNEAAGKVYGQSTYTNIPQSQYDISTTNQNVAGKISTPSSSMPVIAKTGLAYVMNPIPFNIAPRHIAKVPDNYQNFDSSLIPIRNIKPVTTVSVEGSHGVYIPPLKLYKNQPQLQEYNDYSSQNGQIYDNTASLMSTDYKKNEQNYLPEDNQSGQSYQYQYSGYQPTQNNQQQLDNYKITLDDVNYASKRNS